MESVYLFQKIVSQQLGKASGRWMQYIWIPSSWSKSQIQFTLQALNKKAFVAQPAALVIF